MSRWKILKNLPDNPVTFSAKDEFSPPGNLHCRVKIARNANSTHSEGRQRVLEMQMFGFQYFSSRVVEFEKKTPKTERVLTR